MTLHSAPWFRRISATALGIALVFSHILFAAAMPADARQMQDAHIQKATDVEETSSLAVELSGAENFYREQQFVKSVRGKAMVLRYVECD